MSTIFGLPAELLDEICEYLLPHSIENFVLSCKAIYSGCRGGITKHNRYVAKWRHAKDRGPVQRHDVLWFLFEIAKDPLIAEYIETLDMWDRRDYWEIRKEREALGADWNFRKNEKSMNMIRDLVCTRVWAIVQYFRVYINGISWWNRILEEDPHPNTREAYGVITLLILLPNLQELGLPAWWDRFGTNESMRDMLYFIKNWHKDLDSPYEQCPEALYVPLAKLHTLWPYTTSGGTAHFHDIEPFLHLPGLHTVYSTGGMAQWMYFRHGPPNEVSHLRRLEIAFGNIEGEELEDLVAYTPFLEVFKYSHDVKYHGQMMDWDAGSIVRVLSKHCRASLKEFALLERECTNSITGAVTEFAAFERLETIEIDVKLFIDDEAIYDPVGPLETMLPPSIKIVLLNAVKEDLDILGSFFDGLPEAREKRLVQLEKVAVRIERDDADEEMQRVKEYAEGMGVKWLALSEARRANIGWMKEYLAKFDVVADVFGVADDEI